MLSGQVVLVTYELNNTYTVVVQHAPYISIYRGLKKALKAAGDAVRAAESLGLIEDGREVDFELWDNGKRIDPANMIAL